MPPARHTPYALILPPPGAESWHARRTDAPGDSSWPAGLRALLLITGAVSADDAALARVSNDDLALLRVSMSLLGNNDHTSAA
ncbi:hypothetical protein K2Z83_15270 [Oscillochloris sp. ZM17-4]|uniref:hypothetical protein n=1 Tax=Oscillochloris sp. ZM17-4 TaxID=2866714 RepID=UPI001C733C98|nr:hypothetical protein [Oscillochloris sp. ZM17-4]MBX0329038.1 hypothetical protein [Oscillochloris sp. ZM17-4]